MDEPVDEHSRRLRDDEAGGRVVAAGHKDVAAMRTVAEPRHERVLGLRGNAMTVPNDEVTLPANAIVLNASSLFQRPISVSFPIFASIRFASNRRNRAISGFACISEYCSAVTLNIPGASTLPPASSKALIVNNA